MHYISTRGNAPHLDFEQTVLSGLAPDGGLYVPDALPRFRESEIRDLRGLSYPDLFAAVTRPFIGNALPEAELIRIARESYAGFRHSAVAPLKQLGLNDFLLELFHGPTLAFKDFALQFLGRLLEVFLKRSGERLTVVGATSGDTGSAAIEGCRGRAGMRIFILHPAGRVSDVQRRQMTTVRDANVFNIAVDGTFDDCQAIVKSLFADESFRAQTRLTAVNSINWARILAQVVYYFYAALALGAPDRRVSFSVPTGNFGDIYAGYVAKRMGLPVDRLIVATNRNDILARTLAAGEYRVTDTAPSLSPSMDIQVSSNFERLLFDLYGRDAAKVSALMRELKTTGAMTLSADALAALRAEFDAGRADDETTLQTIRDVYRDTGELLDPHTAVGLAVGRRLHAGDGPLVTLATAHPAKFPDAVMKAAGAHPGLPPHLSDLMSLDEAFVPLGNAVAHVKQFIEEQP